MHLVHGREAIVVVGDGGLIGVELHGEVLELLHCSTRANWWSADTQLSGWNHFHGRRPDPGPGGTTVELPIVRTHLASFLNRNNEPQN